MLVSHAPLAYGNAIGMARERGAHPIHIEREVLGTTTEAIGYGATDYVAKPFTIEKYTVHEGAEATEES